MVRCRTKITEAVESATEESSGGEPSRHRVGAAEGDYTPVEGDMLDVAFGDDEENPSSSACPDDEKGLAASCAERDGLLNDAEPTTGALDEKPFAACKPLV